MSVIDEIESAIRAKAVNDFNALIDSSFDELVLKVEAFLPKSKDNPFGGLDGQSMGDIEAFKCAIKEYLAERIAKGASQKLGCRLIEALNALGDKS